MSISKIAVTLSVAVVLGALGSAPIAVAGSDHEDQSGGYKVGPQGQIFGAAPYVSGSPRAYVSSPREAFAAAKHKPVHANPVAASALSPAVAMESLMISHRNKGWDHNYQSWCDVDPACNGWNDKMKAVEGKK